MIVLSILLSTFWLKAVSGQGQQIPLAANSATLVGTWVSSSQGVVTGPNFANPLNFSFNYPKVPGVAYSFTEDGHFEEAWYRFFANGSNPSCITGVLQWQHGTYQAAEAGYLLMTPIASDGRQQVEDTCAPVSNIIQQFNSTVNMSTWSIDTDPILGQMLLLYQFDGTPVQPLYPFANPPIMLPTETLTANVTDGQQSAAGDSAFRKARATLAIGGVGMLCVVLGASITLLW